MASRKIFFSSYFRRASISDALTSQRRIVGSLAFLADLIRRLKTREQAERMILCACRFLPPSQTSVMSKRSDSALRSAKEEVTLVWKSFHFRQNESSGEALPMMTLKFGENLKRRKFGSVQQCRCFAREASLNMYLSSSIFIHFTTNWQQHYVYISSTRCDRVSRA